MEDKIFEKIQAISIGEITAELYKLGAFINYIKSECDGTLLVVEYQGWLIYSIGFNRKDAFELALEEVYYSQELIKKGELQPFNIDKNGRRKDGKRR